MLERIEQTTACINQERRRHKRFRLGAPVVVSWQDAQQVQHGGVGLTRDVSINGLFVLTNSPPPLQAKVKFKVFFSPVARAAKPQQIHDEGLVVRVEAIKNHAARSGFAVAGKRFVLRRGEIRR
jgi:hypothetical protein